MSPRIVVFGTFDLLHPGHLALLSTAAKIAPVTVVLTTDQVIGRYKKRAGVNTYQVRSARLKRLPCVESIVPCDAEPGKFETLQQLKPTTIVLGYDQIKLHQALHKFYDKQPFRPRLITARPYRPEYYKSTLIRDAWE